MGRAGLGWGKRRGRADRRDRAAVGLNVLGGPAPSVGRERSRVRSFAQSRIVRLFVCLQIGRADLPPSEWSSEYAAAACACVCVCVCACVCVCVCVCACACVSVCACACACACVCVGQREVLVLVRVRVAEIGRKRLPNAAWITADFCAAAIRRSTTTARRLGGGPAPAKAKQQKAKQQSPLKGPKASAPPRQSGSRASRRRSRSGRGDPASTRRVRLEYPWSTREYP